MVEYPAAYPPPIITTLFSVAFECSDDDEQQQGRLHRHGHLFIVSFFVYVLPPKSKIVSFSQ